MYTNAIILLFQSDLLPALIIVSVVGGIAVCIVIGVIVCNINKCFKDAINS